MPLCAKDDNVVITKAEDIYIFKCDKGGKVYIELRSNTEYESTNMSETATVAYFYDNQTEIKKVNIKGLKGVKPQYSMYEQEGIFYSDIKVCYFNLPFSKKGDIACVQIEKIIKDPHYFSFIFLSDLQPVKEKTIRVVVPDWMKIEIHEQNLNEDITKEIIEENNQQVYLYHIKNQKAEKYERNMPDRTYIYPFLLVVPQFAIVNGTKKTYFASQDNLYNWYSSILSEVNNNMPVISEIAGNITRNQVSDEGKIKSLFTWVQENIRYIAFENGVAAFKPDDAQEVLRKKYGDCKGMSNLLKSLLIAEGFDARLVWISTDCIASDLALKAPVANHMICALYRNNQFYFLDPTVKYMPLGEYPQTIQGRPCMIENGKDYVVQKVPSFTPALNKDSIHSKYRIEKNILKGISENSFKGESKQIIMSILHSLGKDKQDSSLKRFLANGNSFDEITDVILSGTEPQSEKLVITYKEERKSKIQQSGNELYIDINPDDDFGELIDTVNRVNDYLFPYKINNIREVLLHLPQGYEIKKLPENFVYSNDNYTFSISCQREGDKIIYRKEKIIFEPRLKKELFPEWNTAVNQFRKAGMEQIVLKKN